MKKFVLLTTGLLFTFNSYADEMVFDCPEVVYIDSVVLEHNRPLPFNIDVNAFTKPKAHLTSINLYNNDKPIPSENKGNKNYHWKDLNSYNQGFNDWIYFVCQYENSIQLTKKAIYVSDCKALTVPSNNNKYLISAEFQCE
ncbi:MULTISPECIES: STY0301 family protein [unclassified Gilliamella]|uniref:STY0301 family protein n=1 Tax=unclassified Gilliamella TaxID=2685620 RepID=UPI00226A3E25|nr:MULTISPECIES: STY0301 family protein [unclassified Gilliamella]MCX8640859.1 hypothetical protein [Gilliamella sp. B3835]MCX8707798.1 hypothetical protein [Gilliamella sp. B3783]MCX8709271.1 hypothetical protein [Gilliamella sp. B3780]MCX8713234.1 hypothetical protein [Gilliamella sp. B3468]MCX8713390.1 hypothetical protein [Gilliamella sp. B3781]